MDLVMEKEGLTLDRTYTGKAMHWLVDNIKPVKTVFWLTNNSYDLQPVIDRFSWTNPEEKWRDLPEQLWPLFRDHDIEPQLSLAE